jgi:peroxiredoxin
MPQRIAQLGLVVCWLATAAASSAQTIDDFVLGDINGATRRLDEWRDRPLIVVAFLGVECPLANLYGPRLEELSQRYAARGVQFVGINANQHDSPSEWADFARRHEIGFPMLNDVGNQVADRFGAERTPEVFVLDEHREICYRGRIDNQFEVGARRASATEHDLEQALEELLDGRPVSRPKTTATGCRIARVERTQPVGAIIYSRDIVPIFERRCVTCHRAGQIAPFALTSYEDARGWAAMIGEVVREGRMPPWHADPRYGTFRNDPRLAETEKAQIEHWINDGCPPGDLSSAPRGNAASHDWLIGSPDAVYAPATPFHVPATGILEYQSFTVDPGFTEDRWITAAEIRPSNRAVVHHCNVYLQPPGVDFVAASGELGSFCLAAMASGSPPMILSDGMAKRVPAGWRFCFVVHYVTTGRATIDCTSLGLKFADASTVRQEVATRVLVDLDLNIPPHSSDHRVEKSVVLEDDILLLAMFPHMHLRGKSFAYEVRYPDGARETLLSVPRYDFHWQHRYELSAPKLLPAGTTLCCIAHYDNSAANPNNPDPTVTVRTGPQSTDEMFNGYFDLVRASEYRLQAAAADRWHHLARLLAPIAIIAWFLSRARQRRTTASHDRRTETMTCV